MHRSMQPREADHLLTARRNSRETARLVEVVGDNPNSISGGRVKKKAGNSVCHLNKSLSALHHAAIRGCSVTAIACIPSIAAAAYGCLFSSGRTQVSALVDVSHNYVSQVEFVAERFASGLTRKRSIARFK